MQAASAAVRKPRVQRARLTTSGPALPSLPPCRGRQLHLGAPPPPPPWCPCPPCLPRCPSSACWAAACSRLVCREDHSSCQGGRGAPALPTLKHGWAGRGRIHAAASMAQACTRAAPAAPADRAHCFCRGGCPGQCCHCPSAGAPFGGFRAGLTSSCPRASACFAAMPAPLAPAGCPALWLGRPSHGCRGSLCPLCRGRHPSGLPVKPPKALLPSRALLHPGRPSRTHRTTAMRPPLAPSATQRCSPPSPRRTAPPCPDGPHPASTRLHSQGRAGTACTKRVRKARAAELNRASVCPVEPASHSLLISWHSFPAFPCSTLACMASRGAFAHSALPSLLPCVHDK